ncbi:MAG: YncE family protein [Vicinamibacterales bacterium]
MTHRTLLCLAALSLPLAASAQVAVSSNDGKTTIVDGVNTVPPMPQPDMVSVLDLSVMPPRVIGEVAVPGGWSAPPQSVAVTPDGSLALVTSGARLDPANPSRTVFNDTLTVIDLTATPPAAIATLKTGARAAGVSINAAGTLALVANRAAGTLSVFTIAGRSVTPAGTVDLDAPGSDPSLPVFAPDGRSAYVTRNGDHRVSILAVEGSTVTYTGRDISSNLRPYSIDLTPDGAFAVVGNIGNGPTGGVDTVSLIDLRPPLPRVVDAVVVGLIPEGLAVSPDGQHVAVCIQNGSNLSPRSPLFSTYGLMRIYRIDAARLAQVAEARIGRWCQGVAWSGDGRGVIVQAALDHEIQAFAFDGARLDSRGAVRVTGAPTGLRTPAARPR